MNRRIAILFMFATAHVALSGAVAEGQTLDWPRWRGPEGNGISHEEGWNPRSLIQGPRVLWHLDIGRGYSNVAIKANRLYTLGLEGTCNLVRCLEAGTGKEIWRYSFASAEDPQSTPTVDGSSVYVLSKDGILVCLSAQSGTLRWERDLTTEFGAMEPYYGFAGSPVIERNLVIVTANVSGLALHKQTGRLAWTSRQVPIAHPTWTDRPTGTDYATPVVYSRNRKRWALISSCDGLHSVDVTTGKIDWVYRWERYAGLVADPLIAGDWIYIDGETADSGTPMSLLLDVGSAQPKVRWRSAELATEMTNPVLIDGYLYGCNGGPGMTSTLPSLRCLELATGRLMWENTLGQPRRKGVFSFMGVDDKLILLTDLGMLFILAVSPDGAQVLARADVFRGEHRPRRFYTPPVLCNGRVYCRNYLGELICIDMR